MKTSYASYLQNTGPINFRLNTVQPLTNQQPANNDFDPVPESISDGFFTLDNSWNITYWNKEAENISGIEKEKVLGKGLWNFFDNQGNLKLYSECRRAKRQNISIRFEEFYLLLNKWIEVYAFPTGSGLAVFIKDITGQKTAEAAMKLSNERYDLVVKATNDLVWDWDIITGDIYRNGNGVSRVYGHSSNESIRTNQLWSDHIHPLDKKNIDGLIAYYISSDNETCFNFQYRFRKEDGGYNHIDDKGYIIRNELGIVVRMIGAARDITEQKQAAGNIEESEQRYKSFVQQSTEGIWRVELDEPLAIPASSGEMISYCMANAYVAECNDAFAKMYGFKSATEIIGIPLKKIMPADNPVNLAYFEKFFNNGYKVEDEIIYKYESNGDALVFVNNMLGIVEGGFLKRAWGTQREITRQKEAEELLLASEAQYRNLFNNNPSCIFIWSLEDLKIVEANQAAVDLYGYSRQEFKELTVLDIRSVEDHAEFLQLAEITRHNENYKKTKTWRHITKKGEAIFMEISSQNILYNGKKCLLAIGNNVTDKVQLEISLSEERQQKQKQITDAVITAQERERSKLGEELHDNINQILASTRLYVECAIADDHIRKDLLEKTRLQLDSAMEEIRKLSKTLVSPSLETGSLLESLDELAGDMTSANHLEITKDWQGFNENKKGLDEKLKLTIFRIVQEQLNNIHRHSKATSACISLSRDEKKLVLVVTDNGNGFDMASKRTGLGLRNISSRAEVNNGIVQIESSPGKGCRLKVIFTVTGRSA